MANTSLLWRGSVEPLEVGASGNEYRAWKGAVEPKNIINLLFLWRGSIEPSATNPSGNEIKPWKGAVEPLGVADVVIPPTPATITSRGHISRKPHVVFVDQEEEIEEQEIPAKNMLRITPEVERILDRHRKKEPEATKGGLLGKRKGLL